MSIYRRKDSKVWYASLKRHDGSRGVRVSTGETDRTAAQRRANELQIQYWESTPQTSERTWGEAVIAWTKAAPRSQSELYSLRKFATHFKDCALSAVTRDSVDHALGFCKTASTYMRYRAMIAAILNMAKTAGWVATVPTLATRRDRKKARARMWLTHEQWDKLYAELPPHMKPMAAFAVETGLRQANVLGLTWKRVDLEHQRVWVEAEDTKEDRAITVPLNDRAAEILRSVAGQHPEFVFTYRGHPVKEIKTAFIAACLRAGLGSYESGRYSGFTWHGLRHTWATWHMQNDTPSRAVQELGAWRDPRMVETYAHHSPSYVARFAANNRKKS